MSGEATARLEGLLRPVVEGCGLVLEDVTVGTAGRRRLVRVTVDLSDGPGGVGSDALTEVSHAVSRALDDTDIIPGAYVLEVSTPGTDRRLTEPRHLRRAQGRLVRLRMRDGARLRGRVVAADGEGITLAADGGRTAVAYADVVDGVVEVELRAIEEVED